MWEHKWCKKATKLLSHAMSCQSNLVFTCICWAFCCSDVFVHVFVRGQSSINTFESPGAAIWKVFVVETEKGLTLNNWGAEWEYALTTHTHAHTRTRRAEVSHQTHLVRAKPASSIIHMYMLPVHRSLSGFAGEMEWAIRGQTGKKRQRWTEKEKGGGVEMGTKIASINKGRWCEIKCRDGSRERDGARAIFITSSPKSCNTRLSWFQSSLIWNWFARVMSI